MDDEVGGLVYGCVLKVCGEVFFVLREVWECGFDSGDFFVVLEGVLIWWSYNIFGYFDIFFGNWYFIWDWWSEGVIFWDIYCVWGGVGSFLFYWFW